MITEHVITRQLPTPKAMPALDEALRAAVGASYLGAGSGPYGIKVLLQDGVGADTATAVVLAHDFATRTAGQIAEDAARVDWSDLLAGAQAALAQIESDLTVLQGTPSNAQVVQGVIRLCQRQRSIIKGLLFVARRVNGG